MSNKPVSKIYFKIGAVLIVLSPLWAFLIYGGKLFCNPDAPTDNFYPCAGENLLFTFGFILGTIILGGLLMYVPYRKKSNIPKK